MNTLESPLEALAFNYVRFGIFTVVNNLWTWVAVITAAVSFWRIKKQVKPALQPRNDRNKSGSQPVLEISPDESCARAPATATASPSVGDVKDVDGLTKGKFTLYYCEEEKEVEGKITTVKVWQDNFSDGECGRVVGENDESEKG
ncbi:hypothetical protein Patl1_13654 [Pistacia atlantica]|uniref:Uncharacterized protein n=1 Tax=Pistacia atlantica TaxID=434234 RepID=A0ACC1AYK2_9ROSI|nr:hypothetical protein Patl1_13654 [Pistacia atlantica]